MSKIITPVRKDDERTVVEAVGEGRFIGRIINGRIVLVQIK